MDRQLELFRWLQTPEGCIAGGATNSWTGSYGEPDSDVTTFYGMWYDWQPVYHDPPSNNWTGMQGWGMERVCSMYYLSGNKNAGLVCKNWAQWVKDTTRVTGGQVIHATNLEWSGNPDEWNKSNFNKTNLNRSLHGSVAAEGLDLGSIASIVKGLMWVSMKDNDEEGLRLAVSVMDAIENYKDDLGYAAEEARADYEKFGGEVYIPSGWTGKNAQGANLQNGVTFIDIRPKYKQDPDWGQVEDFLNGGNPPTFTYHRFWGQTEIMVANGLISIYDLGKYGGGNGGNGGNGGKPGKCSKKITNQGYKCCSANCQVYYTDADGDWGYENGDWCGCGGATEVCPSSITSQGYSCCSSCGPVYYQDQDGDWGYENDWCGMPYDC
jgi:hypothetical protein